ncbi:hypothetical protein RESH_05120 [Rhodopirellula europaea SH398]|uniref:Uncharacterized protein n=1 Tax=Rhodopirellula europaea SH398 TaxID=1263868 RepID=M5RYD8_9BACT|nr:hypothetical protein RESH_05120 [Rhodopirellula europaea SH398]
MNRLTFAPLAKVRMSIGSFVEFGSIFKMERPRFGAGRVAVAKKLAT